MLGLAFDIQEVFNLQTTTQNNMSYGAINYGKRKAKAPS